MNCLSELWSFITQPDFKVSFWSSVLSTAIVALVVWVYVNFFTTIFNSPELVLVIKQNGLYSDKLKLTQRDDGDFEASFRVAIKNKGNLVFKQNEGYWHLYFPDNDQMNVSKEALGFVAAGEVNHLRDIINLPVYPKSFLDIGSDYKILVKKENIAKVKINYFFQTDYGFFPKTAKLDQNTGAVLFSDMGSIEIEQP